MGRVVRVTKWCFSGPQILYLPEDVPRAFKNYREALYTPSLLRKLRILKGKQQTQTQADRQDNK
jgi:hypothetical protein